MKNLLLFAFFSIAILLNSGCASKLMSFEKRKYNKGYHIDLADRKDKKSKAATAEARVYPEQENKNLVSQETKAADLSASETETITEQITNTDEVADASEPAKTLDKTEKKKFFQNPILKNFSGSKIKATAKHSINTLLPENNTAGIDQTMDMNIFSILGALIAGGCLVALAVMLFSNWASVLLLILFISGCFLGLILLIVGANY